MTSYTDYYTERNYYHKRGSYYYDCSGLDLTVLPKFPKIIHEDIFCIDGSLQDLKNSPETALGDFVMNNHVLSSLKGAPKKIGEFFDCGNNLLTSLNYCPKVIGDNFNCNYNRLFSLDFLSLYSAGFLASRE